MWGDTLGCVNVEQQNGLWLGVLKNDKQTIGIDYVGRLWPRFFDK